MLKQYLAAIFIYLSLLSTKGFALEQPIKNTSQIVSSYCQREDKTFATKIEDELFKKNQCIVGSHIEEARRGCCSHHGGVCGCSSDGRAQCCDGALSPSCGC